jgi:ribulose-phosphate 3-epimerase
MVFGAVFVRKSFVIPSTAFARTDHTHWTLDLRHCVGEASYADVRDVCLFIPDGNLLDDSQALALYVQAGNSEWEYRGCVSNGSPSEVFPLQWPTAPDGSLFLNATIGVSVEPVADLAAKESLKLGSKETFAKRVAMDLFRYMESFQAATAISADHMVVPMNVLDRWFTKFQEKFRRDPDFLTRPAEKD